MCGCLSSNKSSSSSSSKTRVAITSSNESTSCEDKYIELLNLDLKVVEILRKHKDELLKETSVKLREWIRNLKRECPDENELQVITEFIENEYTKYNT